RWPVAELDQGEEPQPSCDEQGQGFVLTFRVTVIGGKRKAALGELSYRNARLRNPRPKARFRPGGRGT
ncbi:hypothetical protein, partial [Bradyrhizobium sp.]|uniref:hypothetical protein n=1 Tax=Bradyrhizobium sp. TaxID=376 RepID=UPI003C75FF7E